GIDIAGQLGQDVRATAAGKVVYSGNSLIGYGNLIIIKHNETYLSAYAYCKERLVNEGTVVQAGAIIAKMGQHKNKLARLHFEIRKDGKPVDPVKYLPNK
ncbi:MAG: lipoprotein NlpD, partial [Polaribacter sp.]